MRGYLDRQVQVLKALSDPTRLRILALLNSAELTVSDLVGILTQSQPRLSRHLRILCEAELAQRTSEGVYAYFRALSHPVVEATLATLDPNDAHRVRDDAALFALKGARERARADYFSAQAARWDEIRSWHAPTERVEKAVLNALPGPYRALLDIGTGTARMLELLGHRYEFGLGLDTSAEMLRHARARLDTAALRHARVRHADARAIDLTAGDVPPGGFDAVTIYQVLRHVDRPGLVIAEAARVMAPGATLLAVDFASHDLTFLKTEHHHLWLGLSDADMEMWMAEAGLDMHPPEVLPSRTDGGIAVTLWRATKTVAASIRNFQTKSPAR